MAAKKEEKPAEYMTYPEYLENIKKGIVTEDGHCPVTPLLVMLQGRWKSQLMYEMCIYDTVRVLPIRCSPRDSGNLKTMG